jgi:nicotinamide mononucleotide transporter
MDHLLSFFSELMIFNLESIAVLFSILYVVLVARENIWCWAAAIISVGLYIFICFEAKLYAETGLQFFYLIMAVIGYLFWKKNPNKKQLNIKELSIGNHALILFVGIVFTLILGYILTIHTQAKLPLLDSFTTVFSIIATFMVIKKILENWLYFIAIDLVSIYLYNSRDLQQSAMLFVLYTTIACIGYYNWIRLMEKDA